MRCKGSRLVRAWRVLVDQFASIVIALLAIAAAIAWAMGDGAEAIAILIVLVLNAAVGFATEWQAGRALEALRRQSRMSSRVRREGFETTVDAEELVPGDIIILNAGDRVPADARLVEAVRLEAEESALTGESTTVEKSIDPVPVQTPLAERRSMLYLGTAIAAGRAVGIVVSTGTATQLGKIGRLVATATKEPSPLEIQLANLGRRLVYLVLAIAAIVMITGWLRGDGLWLMVEVGISLAVAAVPEGLPAVTTLILALGVLRMARQHAIMRRLAAVETLGSTTVICTDKTGTLTENRMAVREYYLSDDRRIEIEAPEASLDNDQLLQQAVRIGILCNEAAFRAGATDGTRTIGDPTETALLVVADTLVLDVSNERAIHPKVGRATFSRIDKADDNVASHCCGSAPCSLERSAGRCARRLFKLCRCQRRRCRSGCDRRSADLQRRMNKWRNEHCGCWAWLSNTSKLIRSIRRTKHSKAATRSWDWSA